MKIRRDAYSRRRRTNARRQHDALLSVAVVAAVLVAAAAGAEVLVQFGTDMRYVDNASDPGIAGHAWTDPSYDDASWSAGRYGIGFEGGSGAEELFLTSVPIGTQSIYTRVRFDIADVGAVTSLVLGVDHDDAWVA